MHDDDFYIGYESRMPAAMARTVLAAVALTLAAGALAASLFVMSERPLADARFEFGVRRTFSGYLALEPAPVLLVRDGETLQRYWLVGAGKFGAQAALSAVAPGWVTLDGSLVERERWRMIEIVEGSVRPAPRGKGHRPATTDSGHLTTLRGEIVDSKCYLGVMNPGERTVHRDCAIRCLSGGVTPMFAFHDEARSHVALLLAPRIEPAMIGRQVTLTGRLSGPDEALVLVVGDGGVR